MSVFFPQTQPGGLTQIVDRAAALTNVNWWVNSAAGTNATGHGGSPDAPLDSLAYLVTNATALGVAVRDTVYLMPGHAESIAAAAACTVATAGLRIIGLGHGSLIPTITLGTDAGATIDVSAANVLFHNVKVISDLADVAAGITAAATADGLTVEDCIFTDGGLTKELVIGISLAAACDECAIRRNRFYTDVSAETGGCASAIKLAGESVRTVIEDNFSYGHYTVANIDGSTALSTQILIRRNELVNIDTGAGLTVSVHAGTTGLLSNNRSAGTRNGTRPVAITAAYAIENYGIDAVAASGLIDPAVGAF